MAVMITEELHQIAEEELAHQHQCKHRLFVCMGTTCLSAHSDTVKATLEAELEKHELSETCQVVGGGCQGLCAAGPMVAIEPEGVVYQKVQPEDAAEVIEKLGQTPIEHLL